MVLRRYRAGSLPLGVWAVIGLVLALIPAGIVQVLLERDARQERTEQLGEQAMRFTRLVAQQQNSTIEAARQMLSSMTSHDAVRALRPSPECDAFLERIVAANPRYLTASIFDRQGRSICHAHEATRSFDVSDRPYFQRVMRENSFQVGEFAVGRASGRRSLHLAAPLSDAAGQPAAVILLALSLDWLVADLQRMPLPAGSVATIADRDGVILARTLQPERFVGQALPYFAQAWLTAPAPGVDDVLSLDGVRRLVGFLPVAKEPLGLLITVGLEATAELGAVIAAERRAALMIIGSLLLTFALAILVFYATVERPVDRLLATVRSWEDENWSARVGPIGGGREFRRLAAAFDSMADNATAREAARLRAQNRMQAVTAVAPQVVLTADLHGQVDWINRHWEDVTGLTLAESRGAGWLAAVHPEDRESVANAWGAALADVEHGGQVPFAREIRICHASRHEWRWHLFTGAPTRTSSGKPIAWTTVGLDDHDRRQAEADREEIAARLRATYESAPVGLCLMDSNLCYVAINDMLAETNGHPAAAHIGQSLEAMAPQVAEIVAPIMRQVLETGQPVEALELSRKVGGEERYWLCGYFPIRSDDGAVTGVSASVLDITTRKRIEASERMLSREVDHRAQNVLTVVRGLMRLSAAEIEDDVPALVAVLEGRISALSRVHNLLAQERWASADLKELLTQELAPLLTQVTMAGPPLRLAAEAAQPFALVVHELLTNCVKYGAFSLPSGRVTVCWRVIGAQVALDWVERGGPEILATPTRVGLGSQLMEANAGAQLAGHLEREWLRTGLHVTLTIGEVAFAGELAPAIAWRELGLAGRRVLIADDELERARDLAATLQAAGCEILGPATSIAAALAMMEQAGTVDAALLAGTLQGVSAQLLTQSLDRRAVVTLHIPGTGDPSDTALAPTTFPNAPILLEALAAALARGREADEARLTG